jgi:hypothetical protein
VSLTKKITFYITLFFVYLILIEFTSRALVFYKTKNSSIFLFGFSKNIKFEISDLSDLQFNVKNLNKTPKIKKIQKKNNDKDDVFTIWTYGASLTYGYSCGNESSSWPDELKNINKKIEIVNFGMAGIYSDYSIKKLIYSLSANVLKKPDMIIWAHRDEEILSIYRGIERNRNKITKKYKTKKIKPTSHFLLRLIKTVEDKFVLFKVMNYGFHKINHTAHKSRDVIKPTDSDYKLAIENFKWNTLDAINISKEHNINEFVILSLFIAEQAYVKPSKHSVFAKEYYKTALFIRDFHKISFLDSIKYLSDINRENIDKYFCENGHFNLMGNKLIAKIINDHILQK